MIFKNKQNMKKRSAVDEDLERLDELSRELQLIRMPVAPTYDVAAARKAQEEAIQAMDQIEKIDKILVYMKKHGTSISNEKIKRDAFDCYAEKLRDNRESLIREAERNVKRRTNIMSNSKKKGGQRRRGTRKRRSVRSRR